jgi:hypothetical protein
VQFRLVRGVEVLPRQTPRPSKNNDPLKDRYEETGYPVEGRGLSESSFSCPSSKRPGRGCPVSDLRSLSGSLK